MKDTIYIRDLRVETIIGIFGWEREVRQQISMDLDFEFDVSVPGKSDSIEDTLDYCHVINTVKDQITSANFSLIEKLAEVIAQKVLSFPKVNEVRINLSKLSPPIDNFEGRITINITRKKEDNI